MAGLVELARAHTLLSDDQIDHLQRLAGSWGLLADLCFADLLLFAPVGQGQEDGFIVLGQVRPATSQTLYRSDLMGEMVSAAERPVVSRCLQRDEMIEGEVTSAAVRELVRIECIPVRAEGVPIAVLTRARIGSITWAVAVLLVISVRNVTSRHVPSTTYSGFVRPTSAKTFPHQ